MRFLFLTAALAAACLSAAPADAAVRKIKIVETRSAGQRQGNVAAVRGRADIHEDATLQGMDVNIIGNDGKVQFIGFIPKLNEFEFPQAATLNGRQVVMYGVIEILQGLPATQLIFGDQLRPAPGT